MGDLIPNQTPRRHAAGCAALILASLAFLALVVVGAATVIGEVLG